VATIFCANIQSDHFQPFRVIYEYLNLMILGFESSIENRLSYKLMCIYFRSMIGFNELCFGRINPCET
jgi:hypothetical protein